MKIIWKVFKIVLGLAFILFSVFLALIGEIQWWWVPICIVAVVGADNFLGGEKKTEDKGVNQEIAELKAKIANLEVDRERENE